MTEGHGLKYQTDERSYANSGWTGVLGCKKNRAPLTGHLAVTGFRLGGTAVRPSGRRRAPTNRWPSSGGPAPITRATAYLSHPAAAAEPAFPARVPCPGRSASAPARRPPHPRSGRLGHHHPLRRSGRLPAAPGGRAGPCAPRAPSSLPRAPGGRPSARPAPPRAPTPAAGGLRAPLGGWGGRPREVAAAEARPRPPRSQRRPRRPRRCLPPAGLKALVEKETDVSAFASPGRGREAL